MKLHRLTIRRLPGIDRELSVEPATDRPTVITGPNASGKTSLVRALHALLRPAGAPEFVDLDARFEHDGAHWDGRALGSARHWQRNGEEHAPPDWPDADQLDAFLIRADDLLDVGATETGIAEALRRLLAGGFDLDRVRTTDAFRLAPRPQKLHREHEQRLRQLDDLERRQAELADEVERLDELRAELEAAREAESRRRAIERAVKAVEHRQTLATVCRRLDELGSGFGQLDGKEGERLAEIEDELDERARRERTQQRALQDARDRIEATGIADLDAAEAARQGLVDDLRRWQALDAKRRELEQQRERADEHRREAARRGGARGGHVIPVPDLEAVDALDDAAARLEAARTELDRLNREQSAVAELDDPGAELDAARDAGRALRDWLSARPPSAIAWTLNGIALVVLLASGLPWTGAVPAEFVLPLPTGWLALRPLLLGAAAAPLALLIAGGLRARRSGAARRRFEALGVDGPEHWEPVSVARRAGEIDHHSAELVLRRRQWERGLERAGEIEQAERARGEAHAAWQRACTALGLDPDQTDSSAAHRYRLRELHDLQRAEQRAGDARAALDTLAEQATALQRRIADRLTVLSGDEPAPDSAEALADRLRLLESRINEAREARSGIEVARSRLQQLAEDRDALHDRRERLYTNAGLGRGDDALFLDPGSTADDAATDRRSLLHQRLRLLPEWQSLEAERRRLGRAVAEDEEALRNASDLRRLVDQNDLDGLREQLGAVAESAERRDELVREIERVTAERRRALDERELEALNADRERLRDQLADAREARLFAAAGGFLVERAQSRHVADHQPELLKRAGAWFGRFTHAGWALEFDGKNFAARELASGEQRSLAQLSTATRIQLLLALRLAWMDEIGRDRATPPIVLDEVLATSDPARYQAVVEAGAELVRAGRQLIYLSAQPADVEAWTRFHAEPEPRVIELAPTRDDTGFRFTPDRPLPCPDTALAPAEWALEAGVPPLDPFAPAERVALFHLAPDRLADLNALRARRIVTLGQFEQAETLDALPLGDDAADRFEARIRAVRAWLPLWQRGHARPVTAEVIHRSEAVSEKFINEVVDLDTELQGHGPALIEALREGRVKGFRTAKIDDLEAYLDAAGCLAAERPVSDAERIHTLTRTGPLTDPDAERLDAWLRAGVASVG
ncbi:hypothetical protein HFP89_09165 [Wenzhouxiangella sp. XN79A]|uniref:hypothetical protein n=1 Tax=Wenzhouxiangella sp. XN79A TaxID=2724193 RepID=UPI00144AA294|nr:hypothetical protein [Wenzhouxiangella sp. XN79A]NKI35336.1 hypothetical protein [Wenzhouxiangella sp. XN79A]